MDPQQATEHMMRKFLDFDKLCFDKCIEKPDRKFSVKEENCLKNCSVKVLNALDFLHNLNDKGGMKRLEGQGQKSSFF